MIAGRRSITGAAFRRLVRYRSPASQSGPCPCLDGRMRRMIVQAVRAKPELSNLPTSVGFIKDEWNTPARPYLLTRGVCQSVRAGESPTPEPACKRAWHIHKLKPGSTDLPTNCGACDATHSSSRYLCRQEPVGIERTRLRKTGCPLAATSRPHLAFPLLQDLARVLSS